MSFLHPALFVIFVLVASGCTSEPEPAVDEEDVRALLGTWSADDTTRFVFYEDGRALWILGEREDTFRIEYDYAPDAEPAHLNLSGFDRGFLRGRTLYCIVAFDSVAVFRMDCEPAEGTEVDVRPDTFSQTTMTYRSNRAE